MNELIDLWVKKNLSSSIQESVISNINKYAGLLKKERKIRNIIGSKNKDEIIEKHIVPCMELSLSVEGSKGVDVGSGNGIPGIVIAIICREKKIFLMEPKKSRINFLKKVIREIEIRNAEIISIRAEKAGKNKDLREKFDFATARALADINISAELVLPLLNIGGRFYAQTGKKWSEIKKKSREKIIMLGGEKEKEKDNLLVILKKNSTPEKYPRKWKKIIK